MHADVYDRRDGICIYYAGTSEYRTDGITHGYPSHT
jgi:hypothetical protein